MMNTKLELWRYTLEFNRFKLSVLRSLVAEVYLLVKVGTRTWAAKWNQTILLAICTLLWCNHRELDLNKQIIVFLIWD